MRLFKYNLFCLLAISSVAGFGQNRPKVTLLDNYFKCKGCELSNPKVPKSRIIREISTYKLPGEAAEKIKNYFTSEGDHFILFCESCSVQPKTVGYMVNKTTIKSPYKGFGTYLGRKGGNLKGGEKFFKFNDLLQFLTDSVLVFDSINLSMENVVDKNQINPASLRATFQFKNNFIERAIPYDAEKRTYHLNFRTLFGSSLTRSTTDTIPVALYYYTSDNEKLIVPGVLKVFFATEDEKEDMAALYALYKNAFPDWTIEEIANELVLKVSEKYNKASMANFIEWLKNLK